MSEKLKPDTEKVIEVQLGQEFKLAPDFDQMTMYDLQAASMEISFRLEGQGQGGRFIIATETELDESNYYHTPLGEVRVPGVYGYASGLRVNPKAGYRAFPVSVDLEFDVDSEDKRQNYRNVVCRMVAGGVEYTSQSTSDFENSWEEPMSGACLPIFNQDKNAFNEITFKFEKLQEEN